MAKRELESDASKQSDAPHDGLGASENVPVVLRLHLPDVLAAVHVVAH